MTAISEAKLTDRYNREAAAYRELWAPVLRIAARRLVSEIAGSRADRVLDVGTGVGAIVPDLQAAFPGARVIAVDRAHGMLAHAPATIPRAVMDASRLGIAGAAVDIVLAIFMLFHLPEPVAGLREARRVLRPGGRAGTLTWSGELESPASRIWSECLDAHGAAPPDPEAQASHDRVGTPERMEALFGEAGFASNRCWTDELATTIDLEHLIRLKTSLGQSRARFESLGAAAREACVTAARQRMRGLAPGDFVARGRVVFGVARTARRSA